MVGRRIRMAIEKKIEKAKMEITQAVTKARRESGLPMYMIELIVAGILGDIRDVKCMEMAMKIEGEREEEKENGGSEIRGNEDKQKHEETEVQAVNESEETV